jgi:hypothetical protein
MNRDQVNTSDISLLPAVVGRAKYGMDSAITPLVSA